MKIFNTEREQIAVLTTVIITTFSFLVFYALGFYAGRQP